MPPCIRLVPPFPLGIIFHCGCPVWSVLSLPWQQEVPQCTTETLWFGTLVLYVIAEVSQGCWIDIGFRVVASLLSRWCPCTGIVPIAMATGSTTVQYSDIVVWAVELTQQGQFNSCFLRMFVLLHSWYQGFLKGIIYAVHSSLVTLLSLSGKC